MKTKNNCNNQSGRIWSYCDLDSHQVLLCLKMTHLISRQLTTTIAEWRILWQSTTGLKRKKHLWQHLQLQMFFHQWQTFPILPLVHLSEKDPLNNLQCHLFNLTATLIWKTMVMFLLFCHRAFCVILRMLATRTREGSLIAWKSTRLCIPTKTKSHLDQAHRIANMTINGASAHQTQKKLFRVHRRESHSVTFC